MRLYAITGAARLASNRQAAEDMLLALTSQWAAGGVEVIQIRELHLTSSVLESLARRIMSTLRDAQSGMASEARTKVLINGRVDVALAAGADGVHLPGHQALSPAEVRQLYAACRRNPPIISVACHSIADIEQARDNGATMALFSPVFGKTLQAGEGSLPGVGLAALREACSAAGPMPVFALGGIRLRNAAACIEAGAAGIAAIRFFQSAEWQSLRR